jgi:hypothetical protein
LDVFPSHIPLTYDWPGKLVSALQPVEKRGCTRQVFMAGFQNL